MLFYFSSTCKDLFTYTEFCLVFLMEEIEGEMAAQFVKV